MTTISHKPSTPPTNVGTPMGRVVLLLFVIAGCIGSVLILAWVPPVSRDALTHHLAVPKLYLAHGALIEIPAIIYSYYPMNLELLYLLPLYFGNDILPKYIHFAFALLTAGLIYRFLKKRLSVTYGLLGVLMFLSLPVIVKLSITVYVDLGLIFFAFASLYYLIRWQEENFGAKFLIISAVFCGLALGTKYNALVILCLHTLFVPVLYAKGQPAAVLEAGAERVPAKAGAPLTALKCMLLYALTAAVVFSPWAVRNIVWKNNPVYPLYDRFFNDNTQATPTEDRQNEEDFQLAAPHKLNSPLIKRRLIYGEPLWYTLLVPLRIFFEGRDDDPKRFDGRLNPYLLLFPIIAIWGLKRDGPQMRSEKKLLLAFAGLYLLLAFFARDMRIRYIGPIIAPLVVLAVYGLQRLADRVSQFTTALQRRLGIALTAAVMGALLLMNAGYVVDQFRVVDPFSYIGGRMDRKAYITRFRPEYPVVQFANTHLDPDAKILGLFLGKRRYYLDREIEFDNGLFYQLTQTGRQWQSILADLRSHGFTHLFIRYDIFQKWSQSVYEPRTLPFVVDFFQNGTRRLFSEGGYGLYALNPAEN